MASHILPAVRTAATRGLVSASRAPTRSFRTSQILRQEVVAPVKKPVGAFRGGLFGFLLGATTAAGGMYYYVIDEYRISNELLTEDIYALQAAVQRIEGYVKTLEVKLDSKKK